MRRSKGQEGEEVTTETEPEDGSQSPQDHVATSTYESARHVRGKICMDLRK